MAASNPLSFRIEGMDCAACAVKIENAMKRLPGVSAINVSYTSKRLSLSLDADRTAESTVEGRIRALGYTPVREDGAARSQAKAPATQRQPWWRTQKGKLTIAIGTCCKNNNRPWSICCQSTQSGA